MQNETETYEIRIYAQGPSRCGWKVWPTDGGPAKASGVAESHAAAQLAAKKAKEKLEAKAPKPQA